LLLVFPKLYSVSNIDKRNVESLASGKEAGIKIVSKLFEDDGILNQIMSVFSN